MAELRTLPDQATGVALILVDAQGENSIAVAGGANEALAPEHVGEAFDQLRPGPGDVVLVGHEIPTASATEALRRAKASGAITIFNPAPATGVTPDALTLSDILTPNEGEAAQLVGGTDAGDTDADLDALAAELLGALAGGGRVLLTLGARGARLTRPGRDGVDPGAGRHGGRYRRVRRHAQRRAGGRTRGRDAGGGRGAASGHRRLAVDDSGRRSRRHADRPPARRSRVLPRLNG